MNCIIVDIDGTLANVEHRVHHLLKSPKDWDSFIYVKLEMIYGTIQQRDVKTINNKGGKKCK